MSEQINRVLADRPQNFNTAEQAQARDNIGAMAASASSLFYSTSNPSGFITGVDLSNYLTSVNHDSNLSGSGTVGTPLGLNSSIVFTSSNRQNTIQSDKVEFTAKVNPLVFTGTYRPWGWDISGSATSTTGVTNPQTSIVQSTSYFSMYNTSDDNEKAQGYMTFRGCGFGASGTGGAGDEIHTNISTLGITSISGYMGTASSHTGFYLNNGADPDRPLELKFESGSATAKVDIDSINRWNSYSAATQISSRSYPYTDAVAYTGLTIYSPYETYGAAIQDPSSTNIGYLVPQYLAPADLGKVLTVVSDDGYKCEWKDPTGGPKRSHTAELYLYSSVNGDDDYHVRNVKNYCINHVVVSNHSSDMCSVVIEAPTLATGEEYDYVVVFDCVNSSGSCNVSVENCDPEIEIKWEVDTTAVPMKTYAIDVSYTEVSWTGSPQYQIEVIGGRWQRHRF